MIKNTNSVYDIKQNLICSRVKGYNRNWLLASALIIIAVSLFIAGCNNKSFITSEPEGVISLGFRSVYRSLPDAFDADVSVYGEGVISETFRIRIIESGDIHRATSPITVRFLRGFHLKISANINNADWIGYGSYDPDSDTSREIQIYLYEDEGNFAGGSGTAADPYFVASADHINRIRDHLNAHFRQMGDINFDTSPYNEGTGWKPIGRHIDGGHPDNEPPFTGHFDGNNFKIKRLTIKDVTQKSHGLFGLIQDAVIENVNLVNVYVEGNWATGALVGSKSGSVIDNCSSSGIIKCFGLGEGYAGGTDGIGGLIGVAGASGVVRNSRSSCTVINGAGGLIGQSATNVENCYATGNVTSHGQGTGGLIGVNTGNITDSYATGNVSGPFHVGGLVGTARGGIITGSYATGKVTQKEDHFGQAGLVGGLVGENSRGQIIRSYAKGDVMSESGPAGGLVGRNTEFAGTQALIDRCYATGNVSARARVGGLVGLNLESSVRNSYAKGNVSGVEHSVGGLIGHYQISPIYYQERFLINCYSLGKATGAESIGGMFGYSDGPVTNSYWNTQTSNHTGSPAGEGRTTAEMTYPYSPNTYINWDFNTIWNADTEGVNNGYPYLMDIPN